MNNHQETAEIRERALAFFLASRCNFGKYRGQTWSAILEFDPAYIIWADANVEWLTIPSEVTTQAQANNSVKKDTRELKQPYDDSFDEEDYYPINAYDMLDDH